MEQLWFLLKLAFEVIGAEWIRDVKPGEIVIIDDSGIQYDNYTNDTQLAICSMEYIYFARRLQHPWCQRPYSPQENGGSIGADSNMKADIVVGVPNSSLSAA